MTFWQEPVTSLLVSAGNHREMVGFGSRNTVPVSDGRLCSVPVGSLWKREKPATGSGHRIPASMFRLFPEFSGPERTIRFDLGYRSLLDINIIFFLIIFFYSFFYHVLL